MAITIVKHPVAFVPAYNDINYIVSSTNTAQPNFKYIADIYIGADMIRVSANIDPNYTNGYFNIGRIVESYISSDIDKSSGFQENINSHTTFVVKFGEEYGATPVVYADLTVASFRNIYNAVFDFIPFINYNYTDHVANTLSPSGLLTNMPSIVDIGISEDAWIYGIAETNGEIAFAEVVTYNASSGVIQTVLIQNSNSYDFVRFGCGTSNLNTIASSGVVSGALPIYTSSVAYYEVRFLSGFGQVTTTKQTYLVNDVCTRNNTYRFHFLNKLGGFDSFTFYRASTKTSSINRSSYKKVASIPLSASTIGYSANSRGRVDFDVKSSDNIKALSDWINEETMAWLDELFTSPEVYLDDADSGLIAVNINKA